MSHLLFLLKNNLYFIHVRFIILGRVFANPCTWVDLEAQSVAFKSKWGTEKFKKYFFNLKNGHKGYK